MEVFDTVQKLIPIRTVPELERWAANYGAIPPPNDPVPYLKKQLKSLFLGARCDYIYKTLCPRVDMLYQMFFTNALACALLTFSYLAEKEKAEREKAELKRKEDERAEREKTEREKTEREKTERKKRKKQKKQKKAENDVKAGEDLSQHYSSRFYANENVWIKEGLRRYTPKRASLSKGLEQAISVETSFLNETEKEKLLDYCQSLGMFPSEFVLPYSLLPKEIEFRIDPENYYYIPSFLSPITTEMVGQLVTDQARLKRDAAGTEAIKDRLPPMLEQHICTIFRQVLHWVVTDPQHKSSNTIAQSKSRLLKTYNCFI